jgi:hypothetical protein
MMNPPPLLFCIKSKDILLCAGACWLTLALLQKQKSTIGSTFRLARMITMWDNMSLLLVSHVG